MNRRDFFKTCGISALGCLGLGAAVKAAPVIVTTNHVGKERTWPPFKPKPIGHSDLSEFMEKHKGNIIETRQPGDKIIFHIRKPLSASGVSGEDMFEGNEEMAGSFISFSERDTENASKVLAIQSPHIIKVSEPHG